MENFEEKESLFVYTFRYMWKNKKDDKICTRIITGVEEEHNAFKKALLESKEIEDAVCVYVSQVDVERLEDYISIKKKDGK